MKRRVALARTIKRALRQMRRNASRGSAALEFAMIAPVLFLFLFGIIETGIIFFGTGMLQNATDDTARQIRTGGIQGAITAVQIRTQICSEIDGLISPADCLANLQVDVRSFGTFGGAAYGNVTNPNGSLNTGAMQVQAMTDCSVVLLRAFYPWTIMTPMMSRLLATMPNGQYLMSAAAAFRTEPYTASSLC